MSTERSSSAVRNLRSLFENKGPEQSPDTRGRSPSHLTEPSPSRPGSKVRASFVSVVPPSAAPMASNTEEAGVGSGMAELKRESSAGLRRGSFSENDGDSENLLQLKKTVSEEAERRQRDTKVAEVIPEDAAVSAAATPNVKATTNGESEEQHIEESPLAQKVDKEPANPDKPVTAAEEEPNDMKPADMNSAAVVSGGEALPPAVEDLREEEEPSVQEAKKMEKVPEPKEPESTVEETKKPAASKPAPVSTKALAKAASSSVKSPAKLSPSPKSTSATAKPTQLAKKGSRSSLTAPTAASVARAAGQDKASSKPAHPPMPKRDATKPIDLPSRLTAPTAASRARHETASSTNTAAPTTRQSTTSRPTKPTTSSTRPTPRTSLARPESRSSHTASKKSTTSAPAEGSFLERMMRPTAASAGKTHEKSEVKSPPRGASKKQVVKEKVNGMLGKKHEAKTEPEAEPEPAHAEKGAEAATNGDATGNETPIPMSGETNGALEATPAFGEGAIR